MDFRHLIVTCLFSKLRLPFDNQKVKENYAIFINKTGEILWGHRLPIRYMSEQRKIIGSIFRKCWVWNRSITVLYLAGRILF